MSTQLVYHIKHNLSTKNRVVWLHRLAVLGLVFSSFLSLNLWSNNRTYPLSPIVEGFYLSHQLHTLLFIFGIASLLLSLISKKKPLLIGIGIVSFFILILLDITRLQPWLLHYLLILIAFSFFLPTQNRTHQNILDIARIIVVGIYFWSGFTKLNSHFFTTIFPFITKPVWGPLGSNAGELLMFMGFTAPFIEMAFAVGLLTKKFRNISIVACLSMHLFVLYCIGPLGLNWNSSVWPWNIVIATMVVVLFFETNFNLKDFIQKIINRKIFYIFIFLLWIMPLGNFVGLTDHYLSWSLYSGKVPEAAIVGNQAFLETISPEAENGALRLIPWSLTDINAAPYPEERVFLNIFNDICDKNKNVADGISLVIDKKYNIDKEQNQLKTYTCSDF